MLKHLSACAQRTAEVAESAIWIGCNAQHAPPQKRADLVHVPLTAAVGFDPQPLELAAQLQRHLGSTQHPMLVHTVAA